jgi:hypothetical protein
MAFTKNDVILVAQALFGDSAQEKTNFGSQFLKFITEIASHENELTEDAKQHVDLIWKGMFAHFDQTAAKLPDSVDKRKARRMFASAGGTHLNASKLFDRLSTTPDSSIVSLAAAREVFLPLLQNILDVLYDVAKSPLSGVAEFAKVSLLYWAFDELLAGFHLAQCKLPTQAHAHSRTIFEILDKLELFDTKPIWADVWASDDQRKILNELGPSPVRKKLGRDRWDAFFSHLSEVGTHATFRGVQRRTRMDKVSAGDMPKIAMAVGPVVSMESVGFANSVCVVASGAVVLKAMKVFKKRLNEEECVQVTGKTIDVIDAYLGTHLVVDPASSKEDSSAIDALFLKWKGIKS